MIRDRKAVALRYSLEKGVPEVIAHAKGILVHKLLQIARENDITIYTDPDLTEFLSAIDVDSEIPEFLFTAVAEVLAYCYRTNNHFKNKITNREN